MGNLPHLGESAFAMFQALDDASWIFLLILKMTTDRLDFPKSPSFSATSTENSNCLPIPSASEAKSQVKPFKLLPADLMSVELECRRVRADEDETPFSMLVCFHQELGAFQKFTARLPEILTKLDMHPLAGELSQTQLGIVLEPANWSSIDELVDLLDVAADSSTLDLRLYTYPFPLLTDDTLSYPMSQRLQHDSMHPFFAISIPWHKRLFDIVLSGIGLIFLAPLFLVVAILIRCSSPGPVFFRQYRSGLGGKPFKLYKFRSMVNQAECLQSELRHLNEQDGPAFKIGCDPRVTGVGGFLRQSCLDELPQLFNVLRGEMSLVGPRPLPCDESDECRWWQRRRLDVTPGITCTWQARGRELISFDQWMRMDLNYVQNRSFREDLRIILRTMRFVLLRQ